MSSKNVPTIPVAVFDISSSSVGGAHALIKKSATPITRGQQTISILAQSRVAAVAQEELNIERFVAETLKNIETVATTVRAEDPHQPEYIQIVLASPWYTSQTRTITYSKATSFICTERLVNGLIDKEIEYILANETERFGDLGPLYTIVEKQLSLVRLNGYVTHAPYGKRTKSVELHLTVTVAPKRVLEQCTDLLRRIYGTRRIGITTSAYTIFVAARDTAEAAHECVIVDIGEEITDVAFVKDQLFLYQHSFAVGTYELSRSIAASKKYSFAEAPALLEAYRLQKLSGATEGTIATALEAFKSKWQKGLQTIIDEGQYGFALPSLWYVVVEPRFEPLINAVLTTDPYLAHRANDALSPHSITAATMSSVRALPESELDVPLAIGLLFIERLV